MSGVGSVEDVDEDSPPQDGRVFADDDDFPLQKGSSLGGISPPEGKIAPAQVRITKIMTTRLERGVDKKIWT